MRSPTSRLCISPVDVAAARDQAHAIAVTLHAKPIAVIFDFVKPVRAGRQGFAELAQAELERRHDLEIGAEGRKVESDLQEPSGRFCVCRAGGEGTMRIALPYMGILLCLSVLGWMAVGHLP